MRDRKIFVDRQKINLHKNENFQTLKAEKQFARGKSQIRTACEIAECRCVTALKEVRVGERKRNNFLQISNTELDVTVGSQKDLKQRKFRGVNPVRNVFP
jgi:hypothetical protein